MVAEYYFKWGSEGTPGQMLIDLRKSGASFPLERRFRVASASFLGNMAMQQEDIGWKRVAIPEIKRALVADPTQADLLGMLIASELAIGDVKSAQAHYDQFKLVAKKSSLLDMVKQAKQ
jgi:two-component SAPR family response regulator